MTLLELSKHLRNVADEAAAYGNTKAKLYALTLLQDLVVVTPVDTSKALSNWQVTLDTPYSSEREAYSVGIAGSTKLVSGREAVREAKQYLKNKKNGQTIFITNNASYIIDLNNGTSTQAPQGFIEAAINRSTYVLKKNDDIPF